MNDEHQKKLTDYLAAFIEELVGNGVDEVVISPGSRSTPLALLFAHHPGVKTYINVDERSAAFFALGIAKAKKKPVAILCSSGTAGANYYPSVIEARYARVPLIVLTADRPHELREVGAPQAIDQIDLYGKHVKWSIDMALPESIPSMLQYARSSAVRGVALSTGNPEGPVHYNFPFREPLIPDLQKVEFTIGKTGKRVLQGDRQLSPDIKYELQETLLKSERALIVCGPGLSEEAVPSIVRFAEEYALPIVADPLSFVRSGKHSKDTIIDCYDTFLRIDELKESLQPDLIIRFGAMPVSKALMLFLKGLPDIPAWVVSKGEEWQDPTARGTDFIHCGENLFCQSFMEQSGQRNMDWLIEWKRVNKETKDLLVKGHQSWDEGMAVHQLIQHLPEGATLFSSNSMPIRDLDTYFFTNDRSQRIFANRGANGIDGVVSTALGMSTVSHPMYLLIGDLAFFHDLNGLLTARKYQLDMTIVVMNNNGGGIFSYLPQAGDQTHFEDLFGTPMDLEFAHAAKLYGAHYFHVGTQEEFIPALQEAEQSKGIKIIEIVTNREENVANHRKLWNFVSREMTQNLKGEDRDSSSR
ncbi:2-succinyl-5-enolpyruvyl-6-hydroxy-3-cyclohexene-1-carboxylic-acid synthase [Rossellomorea sp. SC111]|uniref:2-succinyl-5-enolpyruvyl-6-hydroxy-3- cyclohexene-1-carboxylic-acid synthase n=1 Tax=Rossellomorea sp. SC111 TaxID=2968985 RepID=UPI00215AA643|nr:2-succinyl-5-enolpyruvyl-6-hydroxy-3-cyclohexene-1-carboxylic-acid synthase [Rossellomorea sp. SC111]MCR8850265.1 2-succinyl-5-enolpyruvyl-6-hydroxy-3-cyclohexene-1-carboxylic-acid synthase [Rossellomorea sp. SC111]